MVGEHVAHALARALAPQRDDHPLAGGLQGEDVPGHRIEDIGIGFGALGREIVPLGEYININNQPFRIIGMFQRYESEQEKKLRELEKDQLS